MITICDTFKDIQQKYNDLKVLAKGGKHIKEFHKLQDHVSDMMNIMESIVTDAESMRDSSIKMEERLREYRKAIEALGFIKKH